MTFGDNLAAGSSGSRRPIWLCADDYGISEAVDKGIRDLLMRGHINATSVMVVAQAFHRSEAASLKMLNAGTHRFAIGLHVTLTAPFAPLSTGFRPLRRGAFLPLSEMLVRGMLRMLSPDRIAIEIATQLKAFVSAFGRPPDFIDGHQHVHLLPQVREPLLEMVKDVAPQAWVRQCGRVSSAGLRFADRKLVPLAPHHLDQNGELQLAAAHHFDRVVSQLLDPDGDIGQQLLVEPLAQVSRRDPLAFAPGARRRVDPRAPAHRN